MPWFKLEEWPEKDRAQMESKGWDWALEYYPVKESELSKEVR